MIRTAHNFAIRTGYFVLTTLVFVFVGTLLLIQPHP